VSRHPRMVAQAVQRVEQGVVRDMFARIATSEHEPSFAIEMPQLAQKAQRLAREWDKMLPLHFHAKGWNDPKSASTFELRPSRPDQLDSANKGECEELQTEPCDHVTVITLDRL
jgi:hypothetical protein